MPHDQLFQYTYSEVVHAHALVAWLFAGRLDGLDLDGLTVVDRSFVDGELGRRNADLVLSIPKTDGGTTWVCVLVEHQSGVDPRMALRLLGYAVRLWERLAKETPAGEPLPSVVPVVVYQGADRWTASRTLSGLLDYAEVAPTVELTYELVDLVRTPEEDLGGTPFGQLALRALRVAHTRRPLDHLARWRPLLRQVRHQPNGLVDLRALMGYLVRVDDRDRRTLNAVTGAALGRELEDIMPSLAEQWFAEGKERGLAEGEKRGLEATVKLARALVLNICRRRGLFLSREDLDRVETCDDPHQLEIWATNASTASQASEVWG